MSIIEADSPIPRDPAALAPDEPSSAPNGRRWRGDVAAVACYLAAGLYVTAKLWLSPQRYTLAGPGGVDLYVFESFMAHGARVVTHLQNPFFTDRLNAPDGVNMMANTSMLGLSIPMTPITLLFGPHFTVLAATVFCLAATASAWYYVLSRHLVTNRFAAFVAGALCGFAPGIISQATGHVNFTAQFLVPFIGWRVIRLGDPGRAVRNGLALGALVIWQAFLNEEYLFYTAIGCAIFVGIWALARPREAVARVRTFAAGLAVAAGLAGLALAYPLYVQFKGPQSYVGLPFDPARFYADAYSFVLFSSESLAGSRHIAAQYARNTSEENTFFGWPLVILAAVLMVWLWRSVIARAATAVALVFASIALGKQVVVAKHPTGIFGPYQHLARYPVFELSMPSRYALMVVPMLAILLALAGDRVAAMGVRWRAGWYAVLVAALLPIAPTPLAVISAPAVPHFITGGAWHGYVEDGRSLVGVPIVSGAPWNIATLRWSSVTNMDFVTPGGYFIGPRGNDDRQARFNAPPRLTGALLDKVARYGVVPQIGDSERRAAMQDLRFWNASVVVLGQHKYEDALHETLDELLGPGQRVDDVWLWDVRSAIR
ncbi:MAG TPA: hypothetical protein VFE14_18790 [Micromonosporaceae bacterium]|nr:hypothetical protein [Micromonosporaceae bacterium]